MRRDRLSSFLVSMALMNDGGFCIMKKTNL